MINRHTEYGLLKVMTGINIWSTIIVGIILIITKKTVGDEVRSLIITLDRFDLTLILVLQITTTLLVYPFFLKTKDIHINLHVESSVNIIINYDRFHKFIFLLILLNIFATTVYGNERLLFIGEKIRPPMFISIINIVQVRQIFNIYFLCARDEEKRIYWINTTLFLIYRIICGWTGDILSIAFMELFLRLKSQKKGNVKNILLKLMKVRTICILSLFLVGSQIYCYVYPLKNIIRFGLTLDSLTPLTYFDGVNRLISRFTNYPVSVTAFQFHNKIAKLYQHQNKPMWEVQSVFAPILPRFIMPNKEYRVVANIVKLAQNPNHPVGTSSGYTPLAYWLNILESDFFCFLVAILLFIVFFIISKSVIYFFDNGNKNVEFIYFSFLNGIFSGGTLNGLFGYGYITLLYFSIPLLWVLGIIKVSIRRKMY